MKKQGLHLVTYLFFCIFLFSCNEILMEDDITSESIKLIAPTDNSDFFSTGISFTWESSNFITNYRLQVARPNFDEPLQIILDTLVSGNVFNYQMNVGEYQWRVRGENSAFFSPYTLRSFKIINNDDFQNNVITLQSPANNIMTNSAMQTLLWQAVIGATTYQVQINDSEGVAIYDEIITDNYLMFSFPEGNFTWRVRAINGALQTLYNSRSLLIDITAPSSPTPFFPKNSANISEGDVIFEWNRNQNQLSSEKDSIYIYNNSALSILYLMDEEVSPFNISLESGNYYWFVKSFDSAGNVSAQSNIFNFTVN